MFREVRLEGLRGGEEFGCDPASSRGDATAPTHDGGQGVQTYRTLIRAPAFDTGNQIVCLILGRSTCQMANASAVNPVIPAIAAKKSSDW